MTKVDYENIDLKEWLQSLRISLLDCENKYKDLKLSKKGEIDMDDLIHPDFPDAEQDEEILYYMGLSLGIIIRALRSTPIFVDNKGLIILRDLLMELQRLDEGGRSDLLKARNVGLLKSKDPIRRRYVKSHAVYCTLLLEGAGYKKGEARKITAKFFSDAGHMGRKGQRLSWKTVDEWCSEYNLKKDEDRGFVMVKTRFERICNSKDWPITKDRALEQVHRISISSELLP